MKRKYPKHYYCELWLMNYYFYLGWSVKEISNWFKNSDLVFEGKDGKTMEFPGGRIALMN